MGQSANVKGYRKSVSHRGPKIVKFEGLNFNAMYFSTYFLLFPNGRHEGMVKRLLSTYRADDSEEIRLQSGTL